jgi:hypothetical protein
MKLLRNIRQALIKEGKLKRYLLYALGEILLVMIGISLAFQFNNWNDNRIQKEAETRYYENIKEQIVDDKALIQSEMEYNNHYMAQFKYASEILKVEDRSKIDTLGLIAINLTNYSDFDRQGNIYETMVNSGQIKLLRNHKIVNAVRVLEERYNYINRMENIHYDVVLKYVIPSINPVINFSTGKVQKQDQIYTYEFQNMIIQLLQVMEEKNQTYNSALFEIEIITALIDQELEIAHF